MHEGSWLLVRHKDGKVLIDRFETDLVQNPKAGDRFLWDPQEPDSALEILFVLSKDTNDILNALQVLMGQDLGEERLDDQFLREIVEAVLSARQS